MDVYHILVIVLSVLLGIFLLFAIIAVIMVIKLIKSLRLIAGKGEQLVDAAEDIGNTLRRNVGATALLKMLLSFVMKSYKLKRK